MARVLHVDADAFFASVEQALVPALRGRPVVVGSGVIASCSYAARRFGLHAGMALHEARARCPAAVVLKGDYQIYRCFAEHVWAVCRRFTCGLETYLDEAYGDATGMDRLHGDPPRLGRTLQQQVQREVGLPVSVGLAANRMLAKLASASVKPRGVAWIPPGRAPAFLADLPVRRLPGVGPRTARMLHDMNLTTVGALRAVGRRTLSALLGRHGELLYERARGRDPQPLRPDRLPRTISRETTFHEPTGDPREIEGMLFYLLERATRTVRRAGLLAGAVELSLRYDDWKHRAAREALPDPTAGDQEVFAAVRRLLGRLHRRRVALRHVGVVLLRLGRDAADATLFQPLDGGGRRRLYRMVDAIRDRYGHAAVVSGKSLELLGRLEQNDYGFVLRTPSLTK
jgi:DNA polymerase-4